MPEKLFRIIVICAVMSVLAGCAEKKAEDEIILFGRDAAAFAETETGTESGTDSQTPEGTSDTEGAAKTENNASSLQEEVQITVHVTGAVCAPGVYSLPDGSRVCDAVAAAGGFSESAASEYLNQARKLEDGEKIVIPFLSDVDTPWGETEAEQAASAEINGKVNLNTATAEELMTLSGIGETKARAILEYRNEHGSFATAEELMNVSGIGEKSYEKIRDGITV